MITGHITPPHTNRDGSISYQVVVELGCDPVSGKRNRRYKTVRGTKKQADAVLRKMINDLENGIDSAPSAMKLSTWMDTWLNTYLLNLEQTTKDDYEDKVRLCIKPTLGHIPLKAINNTNIQVWVNNLLKKGLSPKTIRNVYNNINAALEKAAVLRMIPFNPCKGTVLPKLKKYHANIYSPSNIQQALSVADNTTDYLIILLGAALGLRRGEMAALQWKDINFEKGTVSITQNRVYVKNGVVQKAPKSQAGNRTIKAGHDVITVLNDVKKIYDNAVATTPCFKNLGYVLCKENGEPFHPDSITQRWERFIAKHHLPSIRLHDLRHSNATALIAAGVSPKIVQHRLGHSNVNITLNTYTHVLPSMDDDAAEKLDNALFSATQTVKHPPFII